jgi:ankyrin repeat protein
MSAKRSVLRGSWLVPWLAISALAAPAADLRLLEAVKEQDREAVRSLLDAQADVNAAQPDGTTALAWAAYRDDLETAELLIRSRADVNAANDYGVTPLSLACQNRSASMVEKLLQAGANPNAALWTGETPLMTCASTRSLEAVKSLLAHGADVNAKENQEGQTALMWAVAEKQAGMVQVLVERGADVHARATLTQRSEPFIIKTGGIFGLNYRPNVHFPKSTGGFTPLLFAAQQGDVESARILLAAGANVNDGTAEDGSALIVATASGHEKLAVFLLENGADPNAKDGYGITALHYALHQGLLTLSGFKPSATDDLGWLRPNMPELVKALLAHGADANARIASNFANLDHPFLARASEDHPQIDLEGTTPFILAAASGDVISMRTLVEGRADPKMTTTEGVTPFMVAAGLGTERGSRDEKSAIEAVRLALALGADVNEAKKEDGRTAMHAAAQLGWNDMIQFLAENGAKLDVKDMYGQTPLTIALGDPEGRLYRQLGSGRYDDRFRAGREQKKTAELLLKLGAQPFTGKVRDRSGE